MWIKRSQDLLISRMRVPLLVRWHLYVESAHESSATTSGFLHKGPVMQKVCPCGSSIPVISLYSNNKLGWPMYQIWIRYMKWNLLASKALMGSLMAQDSLSCRRCKIAVAQPWSTALNFTIMMLAVPSKNWVHEILWSIGHYDFSGGMDIHIALTMTKPSIWNRLRVKFIIKN